MSKILRKTAKIFGASLPAAPGGLSVWASTAQGGSTYSTDPNVLQSTYWETGYVDELSGGLPVLEDMNTLGYVTTYQLAYLLQQGIPEYDAATTYFINSFCSYNGGLYISLSDNNLGNTPGSSPGDWQIFSASAKGDSAILNGGMAVAQRGPTGTVTAGSTDYTLDGWRVGATGNNLDWSQASDGADFYPYSLALAANSGNVTDVKVGQRIEASVALGLGLKPWTFQARILNNTPFPLTPTLTINVPSGAENDFAGGVTPLLTAQALQTIEAGQVGVVSYCFQFGPTDGSNWGVEVILDLGGLNNGTSFEIGELDASSTPFFNTGLVNFPPVPQIRPIGLELQNCRHYLRAFRSATFGGTLSTGALWTTASVIDFPVSLGIKMRVSPNISYSNLTDFTVTQAEGPVISAVSSLGVDPAGYDNVPSEIVSLVAGVSGITAGKFCYLSITPSGWLLLSAEL